MNYRTAQGSGGRRGGGGDGGGRGGGKDFNAPEIDRRPAVHPIPRLNTM